MTCVICGSLRGARVGGAGRSNASPSNSARPSIIDHKIGSRSASCRISATVLKSPRSSAPRYRKTARSRKRVGESFELDMVVIPLFRTVNLAQPVERPVYPDARRDLAHAEFFRQRLAAHIMQ